MLLEASVGLLGDTKRFVRTAREIASIFLTDPVKAREIVTQTRWPTEMSQRMIEMYDAGRRSFLSTSSAQYDREVIAEFLTMGHTLVEVSSRPQVAALLAMARNKDYESIRSMGAGRVLSQLEDAGYQHLTKGLYRPIRNAWAHRSYRATETHVEFLEDSGAIKERMSYEELLDSLLAGQETVTALTAGLLCACSELGITLTSILPPADSFPLEPQIEMLGIYFSWRHIVLQQYADDGIEILAEVPTGPLSWPAIFAISSVLPDNFSRMRVTTRDGKLRGEIRLDLMREFVALEGMDQQLSYVRFQRNTVIDGTPLLNGEDLRFFVACCAVQASLEEGVVPAIRTLRKLRSLAQDEGDHELACALNGTIAVNRASWTGLEPSETESSHYRWLIDYAQRKPPSLLL